VIYLIVGVDRSTLAPWHQNIGACDATAAWRAASARAAVDGINLLVVAVIGPSLNVLSISDDVRAAAKAA
jgi:hypothetical protein